MTTPQTNALTYNGFVAALANLAVVQVQTVAGVVQGVDAAFNTLIPQALNYAELRIQRDLDLLPSLTSRSYALATGNNTLTLDVDDFVTVQTISLTANGATFPLLAVTKEFLQNVCGTAAATAIPAYFAMSGGDLANGGNTSNNILVGPYPDANYAVTIYGTVRLPSLYQSATTALAATTTTFISTYYPDLMLQAALIPVSQFQRQFGGVGNAPEMPGSYELQYENLLKTALVEENRKKFSASAWSSMSPPFIASPGR